MELLSGDIGLFECLGLLCCFLLSGVFSGSEAVLMSIGVNRAEQLAAEEGARKKAMTFMLTRPNELLATILVGNNVANILAASLTTTIATRIFQDEVVGISTGIVTIIILIFGEVIPKSFARAHAEKLSVFVIYMLRLMYYSMYPIVEAMVWIIHTVLGERASTSARPMTEDDLEYMLGKAEREKTMDSKQLDLLSSILEFPTIKVKDIMIPRPEVKFLNIDSDFESIINEIRGDIYSRYPVCDGALEKTVGLLHVKDLALVRGELKRHFDIRKILKEPFFVYEYMKIQAVFDYMNRKKIHLALVKDENGLVVGIVTLEDIVEEIVGEIHDEHDEENFAENEKTSEIILEGAISLRDLASEYDIKIPPNDNYSSLSGFILYALGNDFPKQGQVIFWEGLVFELREVHSHEIKSIAIKRAGGKHC